MSTVVVIRGSTIAILCVGETFRLGCIAFAISLADVESMVYCCIVTVYPIRCVPHFVDMSLFSEFCLSHRCCRLSWEGVIVTLNNLRNTLNGEIWVWRSLSEFHAAISIPHSDMIKQLVGLRLSDHRFMHAK